MFLALPQSRVVGGDSAKVGQFPYIVSVRAYSSHICGGTILNKDTILTAAHCVPQKDVEYLTIVAGSPYLEYYGTKYQVKSIKTHEEYNKENFQNDIAILKVTEPIEFNDNVQPIPLEETMDDQERDVILCGWGRLLTEGVTAKQLHWINLKTLSTKKCSDKHNSPEVVESEICTFTKAGEGACYGDSGGPLVANGKQVGIASWGRPCGKGFPDVYTRVSSFFDWINELL